MRKGGTIMSRTLGTRMMLFVFFVSVLLSFAFSSTQAQKQKVAANKKQLFSPSAYCGGCHQDIYKKWKNSLHAKAALDDPIFDAAYMEAMKFSGGQAKTLCLKCHAPTVLVTKDYDAMLAITKEGIPCDFCHTVKSVSPGKENPFVFSDGKTKFGPYKGAQSPVHETMYSPLHEKGEFCGSCHQLNKNGIEILSTYTEWKNGPYAKKGVHCQSCHMPRSAGKVVDPSIKKSKFIMNLHDVQGGHSVEQLKKAVSVKLTSITRVGNEVQVVVTLKNRGSGHKVPTGMPTRELVLQLTAVTGEATLFTGEKVFKKVLADKKGKVLRTEAEIMLNATKITQDNRLAPMKDVPVKFSFYHKEDGKITVSAKLFYRYVPRILTPQEMLVEMGGDEKVYP